MQKKWRLSRSLTLGAQVCVIDAQDQVLLVRHGYRPGWHFPGGGVEFGETILKAAVRELEEEVGIIAGEQLHLFGIYSNHRLFPGDHVALFILRTFSQPSLPAPSFEIAAQAFFHSTSLPEDTAEGTRRRIEEVFRRRDQSPEW